MSIYQTTKNGYFVLSGLNIPNHKGNRHFRRMTEEVARGVSSIAPYIPLPDGRTIRDKRQERYTKELSPEGNFKKTVGDILDALIKAAYGDKTELDVLAAKINTIKQELPEP